MLRKFALVLVTGSALLGAAACAPIGTYQGFQAVEANPQDVRVGQDTRTTVQQRLGTPTATDTFDHNAIWFYISQNQAQTAFLRPRVTRRDVVAIAFDPGTEQVTSVNTYTLADGRVIAYNGRETPTRGREMTVLEQLLGNIGRGGMLPREEDSPGSRPDDRR